MSKPTTRIMLKWFFSAVLLTLLVAICVRFLDIPVAFYVKDHLYGNAKWSRLTSEIPDLLLMTVLLTTFTACSIYLVRTKKGINDAATRFAKLLAWAAPVSYLTKVGLKLMFGRINTRYWLQEPGLYGFHWFQRRTGCEGFPSGHMVVIVTILAAAWRFSPKSRPYCLVTACLLGVALIATNYHFLSDVIAGAYVGIVIEAITYRLVLRETAQPAGSAS